MARLNIPWYAKPTNSPHHAALLLEPVAACSTRSCGDLDICDIIRELRIHSSRLSIISLHQPPLFSRGQIASSISNQPPLTSKQLSNQQSSLSQNYCSPVISNHLLLLTVDSSIENCLETTSLSAKYISSSLRFLFLFQPSHSAPPFHTTNTPIMAPIEKGSTVLVTGANGFIASHILDQLLQLDYKVRGTVRAEAKGKWVQDYFDNKYGKGKLELVVVPDMGAKGAFDDAVKGMPTFAVFLTSPLIPLQAALVLPTSLRTSPSPKTQTMSSPKSLPA